MIFKTAMITCDGLCGEEKIIPVIAVPERPEAVAFARPLPPGWEQSKVMPEKFLCPACVLKGIVESGALKDGAVANGAAEEPRVILSGGNNPE